MIRTMSNRRSRFMVVVGLLVGLAAILQPADLLDKGSARRRSLAGGNRRTSRSPNCRKCSRRVVAHRSAASGCTEVRCCGIHQGRLSGPERIAISGNTDPRHALCAAAFAKVAGVHDHYGPDIGARHWRDYVYFYFGACRNNEVPGSGEPRRIVSPGETKPLLLHGWVQSRERVLPCLV